MILDECPGLYRTKRTDPRIANPTDPNRCRVLEFIVDSGAAFTVVLRKILEELDIKPRSSRTSVLANGEKFDRNLGNAEVEYKGARGVPAPFSHPPIVGILCR
jgi:predicted aspartyl protease